MQHSNRNRLLGYTLLEAVVALGILVATITIVYASMLYQSQRSVKSLEMLQAAQLIRSLQVELSVLNDPQMFGVEGRFRWMVEIISYQPEALVADYSYPSVRAFRISIFDEETETLLITEDIYTDGVR